MAIDVVALCSRMRALRAIQVPQDPTEVGVKAFSAVGADIVRRTQEASDAYAELIQVQAEAAATLRTRRRGLKLKHLELSTDPEFATLKGKAKELAIEARLFAEGGEEVDQLEAEVRRIGAAIQVVDDTRSTLKRCKEVWSKIGSMFCGGYGSGGLDLTDFDGAMGKPGNTV